MVKDENLLPTVEFLSINSIIHWKRLILFNILVNGRACPVAVGFGYNGVGS